MCLGRLIILVGLLSGCAGAGTNLVALRISALPGEQKGWQKIAVGQSLHSGDQYTLRIDAGQPVYVYVARIAPQPDAGIAVLYPRAGTPEQPLGTRGPLLLPGDEPAYALNRQTGNERLRVLASLQPLSPARVEEIVRASVDDKGRDPPPSTMTDKNRGQYVVAARIEPVPGVTVLRFWFRHE